LAPAKCRPNQQTSRAGHFEGWLSNARWGANKKTFEVLFGVRRAAATFAVAEGGFGWHVSFTNFDETFNVWDDVKSWCSAPQTVVFSTAQRGGQPFAMYDIAPEDLATIVVVFQEICTGWGAG
jgi:hypothetical protein